MITFGPVPSRRLGRSLGINNIPPKLCSYSCVYCQVGRTLNFQVERQGFYEPEQILKDVEEKLANSHNETIDYLAFVPDGEPTLDIRLGDSIRAVKPLGIKTAVICNGSLIWDENVQRDLCEADWVSLKVDAVSRKTWRKTDRPHGSLKLGDILAGMLQFQSVYSGELVTETMLAGEINDNVENLEEVSEFLGRLRPGKAYISIPTRPPAEDWVTAPAEEKLNKAYQLFSSCQEHVEYLIGYEGDAFAYTGDPRQDILSITAVHPMREDAVDKLLSRTGATWSVVEELLDNHQLLETIYSGASFYVRRFSKRTSA